MENEIQSSAANQKKKIKKNKGLTLTLIRRDNTYYDMIYGEGGLLGGLGVGRKPVAVPS